MIIYIAGPYSVGDEALNVHNTIKTADKLLDKGHTPYIPHLTHFWHLVSPRPYRFWVDYDLKFLPMCDCVFRMPSESKGADREVEVAKGLGMTIYYYMEEVPNE